MEAEIQEFDQLTTSPQYTTPGLPPGSAPGAAAGGQAPRRG